MKEYLQQLSELELDYLKVLTTSEIISRGNETSETSLNHDEEKLERWP